MRTLVMPLLLMLAGRLASDGQSTNEPFKVRGTVVGIGTVTGMTLAHPHRYVRIDPSRLGVTVRVESVQTPLTNHMKGSLLTFSSGVNTNFFPRAMVQGAAYDFVISRKADRPASTSEDFEFKAPPKLVSQQGGPANRSQPVSPTTNTTPAAVGSGR
jgi:hypothetical protein